jgi:hypothetical protein
MNVHFFGVHDICSSVTFSLIIIHYSFMIIHNHGSIHMNVEVKTETSSILIYNKWLQNDAINYSPFIYFGRNIIWNTTKTTCKCIQNVCRHKIDVVIAYLEYGTKS